MLHETPKTKEKQEKQEKGKEVGVQSYSNFSAAIILGNPDTKVIISHGRKL